MTCVVVCGQVKNTRYWSQFQIQVRIFYFAHKTCKLLHNCEVSLEKILIQLAYRDMIRNWKSEYKHVFVMSWMECFGATGSQRNNRCSGIKSRQRDRNRTLLWKQLQDKQIFHLYSMFALLHSRLLRTIFFFVFYVYVRWTGIPRIRTRHTAVIV